LHDLKKLLGLLDTSQPRKEAALPGSSSDGWSTSSSVLTPTSTVTPECIAALASFEAGSLDSVSRFRLSQRLYGRDAEMTSLQDAYARVLAPNNYSPHAAGPYLVLISGPSGIGQI
jgi:hypothetical protein